MVSELSDKEVVKFCRRARDNGTLRTMLESIVTLDPVLADFLYILDHTTHHEMPLQLDRDARHSVRTVHLTSWQSYGRPEIREFESQIDRIFVNKRVAVILPCSRMRPYQGSRTHKRIWARLKLHGYDPLTVHKIVITSLGVLPEELWNHPVVLTYDAGVPDIYRTLRLARKYFSRNQYQEVVDCLEFEPYSDILRILKGEHLIRSLTRQTARPARHFYLRHTVRSSNRCLLPDGK